MLTKRLHGLTAILAAVIVAGACGTATTTPSGTAGTHSPSASHSPAATYSPSPTDSAAPTSSPSPSDAPSPSATGALAGFDVAMGRAPLLAPAADFGTLAGTEIDDFGLDLLRRLDSNGNLCASPTSIALALAMVRAGARGTTATEMDKVMHGLGSHGQESEIVALIKSLESQTSYDDSGWSSNDPKATPDHTSQQPAVELDVSNAVFSQKGMSLEQAYLDALSSGFGAGVGLLDYKTNPEAARLAINQWASDRTKGRIPEVLQPGDIDGLTRIVLANAIYLKAGWTLPFDPAATKSVPFTRADGSKVSVPTMAFDRQLWYSSGNGYRAVELALGGYESMSMMIVVPNDMGTFVGGLTAAKLADIRAHGGYYDVDLTLPRFSAESRVDLKDVLKAMGMPTLFDKTKADLTGITQDAQDGKLYISKVIHQANIDVVEEGTTASAVTVAIGRATGGGGPAPTPPPHVQFHVNKPFLYFLREQTTGAVLFMGRIADPSVKN